MATNKKTVHDISGEIAYKLVNVNELVGRVNGVFGMKTGWTENARENLITYIKRDENGMEKKVIIVLLGSQDRFRETEELIDWIFKNYAWEWQEIEEFGLN